MMIKGIDIFKYEDIKDMEECMLTINNWLDTILRDIEKESYHEYSSTLCLEDEIDKRNYLDILRKIDSRTTEFIGNCAFTISYVNKVTHRYKIKGRKYNKMIHEIERDREALVFIDIVVSYYINEMKSRHKDSLDHDGYKELSKDIRNQVNRQFFVTRSEYLEKEESNHKRLSDIFKRRKNDEAGGYAN